MRSQQKNISKTCVLMLAYFHTKVTLACLDTLKGQSINKVILIDNSADPNENINSLKMKNLFPNGWLEVIIAPTNLGFSGGMNFARQYADNLNTWDYYLLINNDVEAKPNMLEKLSSYLENNPTTAVVSAATKNKNGLHQGLYYEKITGLLFHNPVWGSFFFLSGHCLLIRASSIKDTLFNPKYFMYGEDIEFNWRIRKEGWKTKVLSTPLLRHEACQSSNSGSLFYEYQVNRGHVLLVKNIGKNTFERSIMYFFRILILTTKGMYRSIKYKQINPIKGAFLCWFNIKIRP